MQHHCFNCGEALNGKTEKCVSCGSFLPVSQRPTRFKRSLLQSRRALFKGSLAAASGVAFAGLGSGVSFAHAFKNAQDSAATILTVARTAEQLAVTFYSNGVANADKLGISGDNLDYLKAALVEEQIHQQLLASSGGQSLADTFSFPDGPQTFTDLKTFINTQQTLEGVFDSAYLAAVCQFAEMGRPDLSQLSAQIACIEAEHRVLGRVIGGLSPADNWAFTPALLTSVGAAPALVQKAGFLSPVQGNSYKYQPVSTDMAGVEQRKPVSNCAMAPGNG